MATLAIVMLLSLVAAGAGFSVGMLLQPEEPEPAEVQTPPLAAGYAEDRSAPAKEHADPNPDVPASAEAEPARTDLKVIPFPPVLTTLAAPGGKWIRLEGAILAAPGTATAPDLLAEQAGEQMLAYLRTVRLEQLQGASGFLALRDDLNETVRTMSDGKVEGILIHGLIVE